MLEERLPNKSEIQITVQTRFKKVIEEDDDVTQVIEKAFHNAIHHVIEKHLIDNDDLEYDVLEDMRDNDVITKKIKEFCQLGEISINIAQTSCEIKTLKFTDKDILECKHNFNDNVCEICGVDMDHFKLMKAASKSKKLTEFK